MNNKFGIGLLCLLFLINCTNIKENNVFLMPNQEMIRANTVKDFSKYYPLTYSQYGGFKAKYNDTLLCDFTLVFINHSEKVGNDILSKEQIEELKEEQIKEIMFDKIPCSAISKTELIGYLKSKYLNAKVEFEDDVNNECKIIDSKTNILLCEIDFVQTGIPGFIIRLFPHVDSGSK